MKFNKSGFLPHPIIVTLHDAKVPEVVLFGYGMKAPMYTLGKLVELTIPPATETNHKYDIGLTLSTIDIPLEPTVPYIQAGICEDMPDLETETNTVFDSITLILLLGALIIFLVFDFIVVLMAIVMYLFQQYPPAYFTEFR